MHVSFDFIDNFESFCFFCVKMLIYYAINLFIGVFIKAKDKENKGDHHFGVGSRIGDSSILKDTYFLWLECERISFSEGLLHVHRLCD